MNLEELKTFCDPARQRPPCQAPFLHDVYLWATDARIAVRVPAPLMPPAGVDCPDLAVAVSLAQLFATVAVTAQPVSFTLPEPSYAPCVQCGGTGGAAPDCERCHGTGETPCPTCGESWTCTSCQGNGTDPSKPKGPCQRCDATGQKRLPIPVPIGGQKYSDLYLSRIAALPGLRFYPSLTEGKPAHFQFTGGDGILMGMRANG